MLTNDEKINYLKEFRSRDKFCESAWNERGLNPSDEEMCEELKIRFNRAASDLISAIESGASDKRLKVILKNSLSAFKKFHYDTEEKEFIVDLFHELSLITEVDFRRNLNTWLYGVVLITFINIVRFFKPQKVIETINHNCTECKAEIRVEVFKKDTTVQTAYWKIGKCLTCGKYTMISYGPHIKKSTIKNFYSEEYLNKEEFTYEQALVRLEQVQFFRK